MAVTASFTLNEAALRRVVTDPGGPVRANIQARARRVEARARELAPVDTGLLRASIHIEGPFLDTAVDAIEFYVVASTSYAVFVHDGTIYVAARPFLEDALQAAG